MHKRKILHIDMDAFFASVEQRDFPDYKGKPLAVGGAPGKRGVIAAASYEARAFGVRSAMSSNLAIKKCPDLIIVSPRMHAYKAVSTQIRSIFSDYTDLVEPLSLDEAYLDVTHNKQGHQSATLIAQNIREKILSETNLTASAGVSFNKFIAKMASDCNKPNGLTVIPPGKERDFLLSLTIERFHGVGPVTAKKMKKLGIHSGADLEKQSRAFLCSHFSSQGDWFYDVVRGIDERPVSANRDRKSVGAEITFEVDIAEAQALFEKLARVRELLFRRIGDVQGRTLTLKVKFSDFRQITRSLTSDNFLAPSDMHQISEDLLGTVIENEKMEIRLLGLSVSNFKLGASELAPEFEQLSLF